MTTLNGQVILLFCETDGGGCGVSDLIFYTNLTRYCAPRLVDLSALRAFLNAPVQPEDFKPAKSINFYD